MRGVVRTRVGYAGGTTADPTYTSLGDHTETVQIEYDPSVITYTELLDAFWRSHHSEQVAWSTQYRSIILVNDGDQMRIAEESLAAESARVGSKLHTAIETLGTFTPAERYHQKYGLQRYPELVAEYSAMYPDFDDIVGSTSAARVNGYLSGYGTVEELEAEIGSLGLSAEAIDLLREVMSRIHYTCGQAERPEGRLFEILRV
jgi:methionine-S-sulfoxide reductase